MLVSVIVPIFNAQKYLAQCIESILNQSYNNIEILLINDGSTDKSLEICNQYKKKDNRIKIYDKKNEGLGLTRNYGMSKSTGKFVVFIDSDDEIDCDLVKKLMTYQTEKECDMVISGHCRIDQESNFLSIRAYDEKEYIGENVKFKLIPMLIGSSPEGGDNISVSACGILYKKSIITKYNIKFKSEKEFISEDLMFNIEYMNYAESVFLLEYAGYFYRQNTNSLTTSYRSDRFEKAKFLYFEEIKVLKKIGVYSICKLRLMKQFYIYLKVCIFQEKKTISKNSKKQSLSNIKKMCLDPLVLDLINNYPIKKLRFKQRIFIRLVQQNCYRLLYFIINYNLVG